MEYKDLWMWQKKFADDAMKAGFTKEQSVFMALRLNYPDL